MFRNCHDAVSGSSYRIDSHDSNVPVTLPNAIHMRALINVIIP